MHIIDASYEILTPIHRDDILHLLELAGRTCYKSEDKCTEESAGPFVSRICNVNKHESVIEHAGMSVMFICDRGITHELVRHRLCAFSQESTRYCNYSKDRFGQEITVIKPLFFPESSPLYDLWFASCEAAESAYFAMLSAGASPQQARSVLPNSLKSQIIVTANLRQWAHIFRLRDSDKAHPQMVEIMRPLHQQMTRLLPELFPI